MLLPLLLSACGPAAPGLTLGPPQAFTTSTLVAEVEPVDNGFGDDLQMRFEWWRDGEVVEGLDGEQVPPGNTARGEQWEVRVWAVDGGTEGRQASDSLAIVNAPPIVSVAGLDAQPSDTELSVTVNVSDPDGDALEWTLSWTRDGQEVDSTSEVIVASQTQAGEIWVATVQADDGQSASTGTLEISIY